MAKKDDILVSPVAKEDRVKEVKVVKIDETKPIYDEKIRIKGIGNDKTALLMERAAAIAVLGKLALDE